MWEHGNNPNGDYTLYTLKHLDGTQCGQLDTTTNLYNYCELDDGLAVHDVMWIRDDQEQPGLRWRLYNRIFDANSDQLETAWTLDNNSRGNAFWARAFPTTSATPSSSQARRSVTTTGLGGVTDTTSDYWVVWNHTRSGWENNHNIRISSAYDDLMDPDFDGNPANEDFNGTAFSVDRIR